MKQLFLNIEQKTTQNCDHWENGNEGPVPTIGWAFCLGGTFHIMMPKGVTQAEQQTVLVEEIWSKFRELKQLEFMEWSTK